VELTVLGAGPAYTDRPGATGAAYLLSSGGQHLLLDLGQGSFPALAAAIEPSGLAGVCVSHLHPDHFIDLVSLRHYLRYEFDPPRCVAVHGPRDLAERLDALHHAPGFAAEALRFEPLDEGVRRIGPFSVAVGRVTHIPDSYGFRVELAGAALVYSGDCSRADDLLPLLRPGVTLLAEASFGAGPVPAGAPHISAPDVARVATAAGAGRILLTHVQMGYDRAAAVEAARAGFAGPVDLVDPGFRTTIGAPTA
jgi:ribonuclease BN (tRNA processing enzyme)